MIDGLSTDSSSADAESNVIHGFTNVYMTDKWFEGSVAISTTDVTLTDVDVYAILYHQFDSYKLITLQTFDFTGKVTNTAGWMYLYLYTVTQVNANKKYTITKIVNHDIPSSITEADVAYRRRKVIDQLLDGYNSEGVWAELFFGPAAATYWEDVSIYLTGVVDNGTN